MISYVNQICKEYNLDILQLQYYIDEVLKWSNQINLVGNYADKEFLTRHVIDSLQISNYINKDNNVLDIGSGAGFPGILIALNGYNVTLVEKSFKKCVFLKHIIKKIELTTLVRCENAYLIKDPYDTVVSRAFSKLTNLLKIQKNVSRETTAGIYLKGKNAIKEIEEAAKEWQFDYEIHPSKSNSEGNIVIIRNLYK